MNNNEFIPSVNFHLWEPCNMRCSFCFATFQDVKQSILPKGHLPKQEALKVVKKLAKAGFTKITFAGGEPLLCPWLPELILEAKLLGMTTMIVTNGSKLTERFLINNREHLDWIAISIDSLNDKTNIKIGRAIVGKHTLTKDFYNETIRLIKKHKYGLKINTVINRHNYLEDFNEFILTSKPKRWKVLQVLPIEGQNDIKIDDTIINNQQFDSFLKRHYNLQSMIPESNDAIKGSYVMVDPAGRFFNNTNAGYNYSPPILEVGIKNALVTMNYNIAKFIDRGGIYNWN